MALQLEKNSKLVMIGDSITDSGRARPIGEGLFDAIGKGYVSLIDGLLTTVYPEYAIRVVNMGSSGNTVLDLKERWQSDVLDLSPDWLSIMIGINDVWRQYDTPRQPEKHVSPDVYEETLFELVAQTRPFVKGLVLMTPFYIEPNPHDDMRARMDQYGRIVKTVAQSNGAIFVDTQAAFNRLLKTIYPATLAWDRVHPNISGHMLLAKSFLDAVGFEWD